MKNIIYLISCLFLLVGLSACQDIIFIPVQGSIEGVITDNNGILLQGVSVTAAYEAPSQQPIASTKTATTDTEGFFQIGDLWDEVVLNTSISGFQPSSVLVDLADDAKPNVSFILEGSPTISDIQLDKSSLNAQETDTLSIVAEVKDPFNDNFGEYIANIIVKDRDGATQMISSMNLQGQGFEVLLFQGTVISTDLGSGNYFITIETRDPDGNQHQLEGGSFSIE